MWGIIVETNAVIKDKLGIVMGDIPMAAVILLVVALVPRVIRHIAQTKIQTDNVHLCSVAQARSMKG